MRLPRTVLIGETTWRVKRCWRLQHIKDGRKGEMLGYCDCERETIVIKRGLSDADAIATFVHELAHALEHELGITIPHKLIYRLDDPIANLIIENFLAG